MDQLIFPSLSHTHYWYEVGMLKVPADPYSAVCDDHTYTHTNDVIVLHFLLGIFLFFYILVRKNPSYRGSNSRPNLSEGGEFTN